MNVRSIVWTPVDLVMTICGVGAVLFPAVLIGMSVFGISLGDTPILMVLVVIVLAGAYPFAAGYWSLGTLREYIFVFIACALVIGSIIAYISPTDRSISSETPVLQTGMMLSVYVTAAVIVYYRNNKTAM